MHLDFGFGEVLTLPLDCEATEGAGADLRYGLRYYIEKTPGGEKCLAVHWFTPLQGELAHIAIAEVKMLTESARNRARILEQNPDTVPLPGISPDAFLTNHQIADLSGAHSKNNCGMLRSKCLHQQSVRSADRRLLYPASAVIAYLFSLRRPLWIVDRHDGTRQSLSESLFIQFRHAGSAVKGTNPLLVEGVRANTINDFLGSCGRSGTKSAFERYNVRDSAGKFCSMNSHQFRHWVTTKAAKAGVMDHVLARWQGREHIEELGAYKHLTSDERLETLKAALRNGRVKGEVAEMFFSLKDDVRDTFLEGQLQAVQITGLGLCVHNFNVTPCPKLLNCVKDCEDYLLDTANQGHINNLVQLQSRTELILDQALQQRAKGDEDLSESWVADHEATLSGVKRILSAASITSITPTGFVRPFKGKGSKFVKAS